MNARTDMAPAASALFSEEWAVYRKMAACNYLHHREAYAALRALVTERLRPRYRFLDVACGDASWTAQALTGTGIGAWHGIDLSADALALARSSVRPLGCTVTLERADFVPALRDRQEQADSAWIGLSLHHLTTAGKLAVLTDLRRLVGPGGFVAFYENTLRPGEDRAAWMARWDAQRPHWTLFSDAEWHRVTDHVRACDWPESDLTWRELGHGAGFARVDELFHTPTGLFRAYAMSGS